MTRYLSEEDPTGKPTITPEEALKAINNKFPRNHGKTQHRKTIAGAIVKNALDEVIRMLVKFGDAAIFSDTQISKAALELTELEFELLRLRQENIELKARLDANRAQVRAMAEEKRRPTPLAPDGADVCHIVTHVFIDGTCAMCGFPEPRPAGKA
jgi:hypothetical protein